MAMQENIHLDLGADASLDLSNISGVTRPIAKIKPRRMVGSVADYNNCMVGLISGGYDRARAHKECSVLIND